MKRVIVLVQYEAYVPQDMSIDSLRDGIEEEFSYSKYYFGVSSDNYHNEDESNVVFTKEDIMIGTSATIMIGGDD